MVENWEWTQGSLEEVMSTARRTHQEVAKKEVEDVKQGVGELLLAVVNYARAVGVNPELALREAADARAEAEVVT